MYYYYYKRSNPNDILVYIEEFDKQRQTVVFDFIDSNEYGLFSATMNVSDRLDRPTMVLLSNYKGRAIRENTIYSIKPKVFQGWRAQVVESFESVNSYLIGYNIDVSNQDNIFSNSVSIDVYSEFLLGVYQGGGGDIGEIPFPKKGRISITVRNVGQGNWNEINFDAIPKIVYDAGAPMWASRKEIGEIIADREDVYSKSKPILMLSHWDKDHYHALLGIDGQGLRNCFSAFICRDRLPNLTSRILFGRIRDALGIDNIYSVPAYDRIARGGPTHLRPTGSIGNQILIYNAENHKNRNISGLALSVKTQFGSVVLPGDAHYLQVSRDILPHLNYKHIHHLVVPHHGGKAGNYIYAMSKQISSGAAVISVGKNPYGHPFKSYIQRLMSDGFAIHYTGDCDDVIIVL